MPDHPVTFRASDTRLLALAAGALLLFLTIAVAVRSGATQALDVALMGRLRGLGGAGLLRPVAYLSDFGSLPILTAEAILAAILLVLNGRRRQAVRLVAIVTLGRIAVEAVKLVVARARPPLIDQAVAVHSFSFPSSHTANATIGYCALAFALTHAAPARRWRPALLAIAAILSLAIGLSRVWLGVHWPVDVLAGWLFGIGWLALAGSIGRGAGRRA